VSTGYVAPNLSIVIPTQGRPSLETTLASIRAVAGPDDVEIVVVGDTTNNDFAEPLRDAMALCSGHRARYAPYDGGAHCWGQPQRNYGQMIATGKWLAFSQDDNVYIDRGLDAMLGDITMSAVMAVPRLYRVQTKFGFVVWMEPFQLALGRIDADCIVVPRVEEKLGQWGLGYNGDWDFIEQTVGNWGAEPIWCNRLLAQHQGMMAHAS
jgi:glycosyltransferase involved in cell wall biosynthesis